MRFLVPLLCSGFLVIQIACTTIPVWVKHTHSHLSSDGRYKRTDYNPATLQEQFHQIYKKNLSDMIVGDTSGDYRKTLMALTA